MGKLARLRPLLEPEAKRATPSCLSHILHPPSNAEETSLLCVLDLPLFWLPPSPSSRLLPSLLSPPPLLDCPLGTSSSASLLLSPPNSCLSSSSGVVGKGASDNPCSILQDSRIGTTPIPSLGPATRTGRRGSGINWLQLLVLASLSSVETVIAKHLSFLTHGSPFSRRVIRMRRASSR